MLKNFFTPKSIAVIGASIKRKKIGHTILYNIIKSGFQGRIYPVNPKYKKILHKKCFSSISEISKKVDVAVIAIPSVNVPDILNECGKKKIKNIIIISSGFSEIGEPGKILEYKVQTISQKYHLNILGPNCLGIIDSFSKLNASFAIEMALRGNVGFISQSGAIISAVIDKSALLGLGFSRIVSLGNKLLLDEVDFINFFLNDQKTKVLLGYFEGIPRGKLFVNLAKKFTSQKPFIVLKAGTSSQGKKAALSHTGVLAGDDNIIHTAFQKANIIRADNLQEFFDCAMLFSWQPMIRGNRIAVIGNAGGPGVITADALSHTALQLAEFKKDTIDVLKVQLPHTASCANPVDLVGDANAQRYRIALDAILKDENVNAVIILLTPQTVTEVNKSADVISKLSKKFKKVVVCSFIGGKKVLQGNTIFIKNKIPFFTYPHQAVTVLNKMHLYTLGNKKSDFGTLQYKKVFPDTKTYDFLKQEFTHCIQNKTQPTPKLGMKLLEIYEIHVIKSVILENSDSLEDKLSSLHFPLAAKVVSPHISHKTDVGGVVLNLKNITEAKDAYNKIKHNVHDKMPTAIIEGIQFQEMQQDAIEVIIGAKRDPQFGPIIMFGLGGIYVEILKDVVFRMAPVSQTEAMNMMKEIRGNKILAGARGQAGYDVKVIAQTINKISQMIIDINEIREIELNPAMVVRGEGGLYVADFRILL